MANASTVETRLPGRERAAIGVVVGDGDYDALARIILRANQRDHAVLVTYADRPPEWVGELVEHASATVVPPRLGEKPADALTNAAEVLGFPDVYVHADVRQYVDYETDVATTVGNGHTRTESLSTVTLPERTDCEVLVGIPAFNEGATIEDVVAEAGEYADEVLVVDDGSSDDTAAAARRGGATVVEHRKNRGYGATLRTIFETAHGRDASHLVVIDGDGQHEVADIPKLVEAQRTGGAEIVTGSRFVGTSNRHIPRYRRAGLLVVNVLTNLSMGVFRPSSWVRDTQCGFRVYDRRAIESLATDGGLGDQMSASTDILYHAHKEGFGIEEVETKVRYDVANSSTHNPIAHGMSLVYNILMTVEKKQPILILGLPGFISAFVGLGFGYWTFSEYIQTSNFPITLAGISAFCTLLGVFACFTAIILHSLKTHLQ